MRTLYHIVVKMPSRDEHPGARREERIFTEFGRRAAMARYRWLAERHPNCVSMPVAQPPELREPIC